MKKIKVLALIFLVLTPTLLFVSPPTVKADAGKAKVYIICLPSPLYGLTFNETQYDPTETRIVCKRLMYLGSKRSKSKPLV